MNDTGKPHWTASETDRKNQRRITTWSLGWVLPFLVADTAIENGWIDNGVSAIAATIGVTILGIGTLLAYRRFLRDADELMRKIQLDALALTVGVGVVAGFSYSLLETADIVAQAETMNLIVIMAATYIISVVVGQRRYA
jgi:hypothetical protein